MKNFFQSVSLILVFALPVHAQEWRDVAPGDIVRLPQDLSFQQGYRVQWWYFTGHLFDGKGREFGYELTFFAGGIQQRKYRSKFGIDTIYVSHFALSDVQLQKFYHAETSEGAAYGFGGANAERLRVWVDQNSLEGSPDRMHIIAQAGERTIDLLLVPAKKAVLNGENGYSRKSEESALRSSLYFSYTHLETKGTVRMGDRVFTVQGKSWFDRELFSQGLAASEAGWDWFALQLDDGREIMLYHLRKKDGTIDHFSSGTFVEKDGTSKHLTRDDFLVNVLSSYRSKNTGIEYPSAWEITIPSKSLKLTVKPRIQDQEFAAAGLIRNAYWEGACSVEGTASGRAYVEMTGYGE